MKIAVAQLDSLPGEVSTNLDRLTASAAKAAQAGAELLLFPEAFDTGYDLEAVRDHADMRTGETWQRVREIATTHTITLVGGLAEREESTIYNSMVAVLADGSLQAVYRKLHLVPRLREPEIFTPGNHLVSLRFGAFQMGLMICYDLRFPEVARSLVQHQHCNLLLIASAWPLPRVRHWETLLRARAIENQCVVAAANRVGTAGVDGTFCGRSVILDPMGNELAEAGSDKESLLLADLSLKSIQETREFLRVLKEVRIPVGNEPDQTLDV